MWNGESRWLFLLRMLLVAHVMQCRMVGSVDNEFEGIWKEATVSKYMVMSWDLSRANERLSGGLKFELRTSQI